MIHYKFRVGFTTLNLLLQLITKVEFSLTRCLHLHHLAMQASSLVKLMCQTFEGYCHKFLPPHPSLPFQKFGSKTVLQIHHLASQNHHLEPAFEAWPTKPFRNNQLQQYKAMGSWLTQRELPTARRYKNSHLFLVTAIPSTYITSSSGSNNTYLCSSRLASSPKGHTFVILGFSFLFFFGTQLSAYLSFCRLFLLALPCLCISVLNLSILNQLNILKYNSVTNVNMIGFYISVHVTHLKY